MNNYSDDRSVLNVLFHPQHPDIFECAYERNGMYSKQCLMPGMMVEILSFIAKRVNLTLKFTMDYDNIYDYDETCQRLNNEEIDVFGTTVRSISTLRENCDLTVPLYSIIWKVFRIQLYQSEPIKFKLSSGKLSITLFALLHGPIMLGIYSSSCLAALMRTPDQRTLQNERYIFEKLRNGRKRLVSWGPLEKFREQVFNHSEQKFLDLQRAVGDHGLETHSTLNEILNSFNNRHNYVYDYKTSGVGLKLLESCATKIAHIDFPPVTRHLMLSKNSQHTKTINETIKQNHEKIKSIYRSYISRMSSTVCKSYKIGDPLNLSFYYGVLLVCSGIITVSLGILFLERLHFKFKRPNRTISTIEL